MELNTKYVVLFLGVVVDVAATAAAVFCKSLLLHEKKRERERI